MAQFNFHGPALFEAHAYGYNWNEVDDAIRAEHELNPARQSGVLHWPVEEPKHSMVWTVTESGPDGLTMDIVVVGYFAPEPIKEDEAPETT